MCKKLTFILFCFLTTLSFGQTKVDVEKNLSAKYSVEEIQQMKELDVTKYNLYMKSFNSGVTITPYDEKLKEKGNSYTVLDITVSNIESFNYLEHNLDLIENSQYYLINGGESLLVIKGTRILNLMK